MKKDTAKKLVQETLQSSFNKEQFIYLLKNILNRFDESKAFHARGYVKEKFRDTTPIVKTYERLGTYIDPEEKKIDLLVVYLQKENSIDRARTSLRNFVADYLKCRDMKDAALVAFVAPGGSDWRFSFVKMEYKFTDQGKVKEEYTPAKRYSFLVGEYENSHTAQKRLFEILCKDDEQDPKLKDLEEVFNVERVTKEFFEKYRDLFLRCKESLDEILKNNPEVKADFEKKDITTVDFAKKLLGQIVFLYFLQKKGWFGVKRGEEWGAGSKSFLRELFEKKHSSYKNFFNELLEPLFYEALRLERSGDYYSRFNCRIPFLNGGLFDPINDYDWWKKDILLPNNLFSNTNKTKEGDSGDGILDIFDRYNFTVKEDEPLEKDVAVDPEMLGKVFENLLEVKDRKSKGTYYTPREIVHYMCQESLTNYLATELNNKVDKKDIETLIKYGESLVEHDSYVIKKGHETERYAFKLSQNIREYAEIIDDKLASIRTCDPAVGSGAFLVGMMNEIIRARNALTPYIGKNNERNPYNFKRQAIQNSLYGVDIDSGAVEIAKLRLWLSLIVDEEDREKIQPLPNLDYKIMQGNSLIELLSSEHLQTSMDQKRNKLVQEFKSFKNELFSITSLSLKKQKRKEIENLISQLFEHDRQKEIEELRQDIMSIRAQNKLFEDKQTKKDDENKIQEIESKVNEIEALKVPDIAEHFEWHINFSEVFQEKGGFDIVIGNPPYVSAVQNSKSDSNFREVYRKQYPLIKGAFDIYVIFLIKGVEIINTKGSFTWIVPNKLLVAIYAENVLEYLKQNGLGTIVSISSIKVFEAGVYPIIILGNKTFDFFLQYEANTLQQFALNNFNTRYEYKEKYQTFSELGIKAASGTTGFQAKQIIKYMSEFSKKTAIPFVVSGSIDPYLINFRDIRYMNKLYRHAFIIKGAGIADSKWKLWNNEKIVIAGMTKRIEATYAEEPLAIGVGVYAIYEYGMFNPKFLLALLNSKFLSHYITIQFKEKHLAGGYLAINKATIERLPIVPANHNMQELLSGLANKILAITKGDDYLQNSNKQAQVKEYEKQIDQLVYKLYNLTDEEINIIEKT